MDLESVADKCAAECAAQPDDGCTGFDIMLQYDYPKFSQCRLYGERQKLSKVGGDFSWNSAQRNDGWPNDVINGGDGTSDTFCAYKIPKWVTTTTTSTTTTTTQTTCLATSAPTGPVVCQSGDLTPQRRRGTESRVGQCRRRHGSGQGLAKGCFCPKYKYSGDGNVDSPVVNYPEVVLRAAHAAQPCGQWRKAVGRCTVRTTSPIGEKMLGNYYNDMMDLESVADKCAAECAAQDDDGCTGFDIMLQYVLPQIF